MGCGPETQVAPAVGQVPGEVGSDDLNVYMLQISMPDISLERQARCNSYVGRPRISADFLDDMAMRGRGGDLKQVYVSDSARSVAYLSEDGRRIIKAFSSEQCIPLYIVEDGICYKKASKRPPAAVSEDEDYFNYETYTSVVFYFRKKDMRHEQAVKNGIVYFRRPRMHECASNYPTDYSISEEFVNDRFDIERRHFARGYIIPEHFSMEVQLDEDICEVSDFRRMKAELCQEDCAIEYINYESYAVIRRDFARNYIIRKVVVAVQNGVPSKFVRRVDPLVDQPEGSFSEEFADDLGTIIRKHFTHAEKRTQELVCTSASATNGIYQRVFRRKIKKTSRRASETAMVQPEAGAGCSEADNLDFDTVARMDFYVDFSDKEESARKYTPYVPAEEELQTLQHYSQLGSPVTCETVAQWFTIDTYQVKQALLQVGSQDLDNITFWQFEKLVSQFANTDPEPWRRSGDLLETDLLD